MSFFQSGELKRDDRPKLTAAIKAVDEDVAATLDRMRAEDDLEQLMKLQALAKQPR